jgi:hypothetical protein
MPPNGLFKTEYKFYDDIDKNVYSNVYYWEIIFVTILWTFNFFVAISNQHDQEIFSNSDSFAAELSLQFS